MNAHLFFSCWYVDKSQPAWSVSSCTPYSTASLYDIGIVSNLNTFGQGIMPVPQLHLARTISQTLEQWSSEPHVWEISTI